MNDTISLQHMPVNAVKLQGILGSTLHNTIINRLNTVNYRNMVDIFRYRNETDNRWRCEFWGKVVRSAIWSLRSEQNQELERGLEDKRLRLSNVGNIAEAALEINDCFCSAQSAAEQYLEEIKAIREETEAERQRILAQARAEAAEIVSKAKDHR